MLLYIIILCPLHNHPSVVDAALCQVLGLNVPLLPCLPSDWIIMITWPVIGHSTWVSARPPGGSGHWGRRGGSQSPRPGRSQCPSWSWRSRCGNILITERLDYMGGSWKTKSIGILLDWVNDLACPLKNFIITLHLERQTNFKTVHQSQRENITWPKHWGGLVCQDCCDGDGGSKQSSENMIY